MQLYEYAFTAMASPCEFKLYSASQEAANKIAEILRGEVHRIEKKYSRYDANSTLSKINAAAGTGHPVAIDEETAGLVNYADQLFKQSEGLFDASSGVLRRAWNFKSGRLPEQEQLNSSLALVGWQSVAFDAHFIELPKKRMEIDFGGFGKEYATDRCAVKAEELGLRHGLINLGGDIRLIGRHPDDSPWEVGIQHPRSSDQAAIARVSLFEGGLATSGDYERYMLVDGTRYSHLLNPKTGECIQPRFCSVSVIADSCLIAGSFSTLSMLHSSDNPDWIKESKLPYLAIDQHLKPSGSLTISL